MASKNSNKISIKPMNNAAAIASTLGISAQSVEPTSRKSSDESVNLEAEAKIPQSKNKPQTVSGEGEKKLKTTESKSTTDQRKSKAVAPPETVGKGNQTPVGTETARTPEMPLMIEIKRKFPGKELFVLSLLYLQRNNRGLVQMTVGSMMALYSAVFGDVIKDDTVRRSLKRLYDAGFIKTTSIPGNNSGYIYEIGDLLETENLNETEKEEFAELTEFVKSRLNTVSA